MFVSGLSIPQFVAVTGNDLLIGSFDGSGKYSVIGKYDGTSGATINRFFISIQSGMEGMAATENHIYVSSESTRSIAVYDAKNGSTITEHLVPFSSTGIAAEGDALWLSEWVRFVGGQTDGNTFKVDGTSGTNAMGLGKDETISMR